MNGRAVSPGNERGERLHLRTSEAVNEDWEVRRTWRIASQSEADMRQLRGSPQINIEENKIECSGMDPTCGVQTGYSSFYSNANVCTHAHIPYACLHA